VTSHDVLDAHRAAGRRFEAAGVGSFVREYGEGITPVVCLHGVPASSFLYRKVLAELAAHGLRASRSTRRDSASPTVPHGSTWQTFRVAEGRITARRWRTWRWAATR
jgi:pimeloyl-ACP methyl ester carboxylesterase